MTSTHRPRRAIASAAAVLALSIAGLTACGSSGTSAAKAAEPDDTATTVAGDHDMSAMSDDVTVGNAKVIDLNGTMRTLWHQHMEWTFITVDAFFNQPDAVDAFMTRLLQNQRDIGDAIEVYYGKDAGDQTAKLLTEHIEGAVPVLQAAKDGDEAALKEATDAWYANAAEVGDALADTNPEWLAADTRAMLEMHIDQTIEYSVDLLEQDYEAAVKAYGEAEAHMAADMADTMTNGIVKQFPEKFED